MQNFRTWTIPAAIIFAMFAFGGIASVAAQEDADARLRTALRSATAQVNELQTKIDQLTAQLATQEQNTARERNAAAARATSQAATQRQTLVQAHEEELQKIQAELTAVTERLTASDMALEEARTAGVAKNAEVKRLEAGIVAARARARASEEKSTKLYSLGREVISIFEQEAQSGFATIDRITKLERVKYENILQDYENKLLDAGLDPEPPAPAQPAAPPAAPPAAEGAPEPAPR